jgi:SAM-dependent methyltransferase
MKARNIEHYSGEELEVLAETFRYQEWIADQFHPYLRGRVMEIGAGVGTMAKRWLTFAKELHLVEPARNLFPVLQGNFHCCPNVSLHHGALEEVLAEDSGLASQVFDAVIMINVLEHIEDDRHILNVVHQMLIPDGNLLIFVPAMPALYGSLDREFGHYRRYTKEGLASVCQEAGYEIIRIRYFDALGIFPWWFINRVLCSSDINPSMARIYDRFVVPLMRYVEKVLPPPFGKNLVLVGRKVERQKAP